MIVGPCVDGMGNGFGPTLLVPMPGEEGEDIPPSSSGLCWVVWANETVAESKSAPANRMRRTIWIPSPRGMRNSSPGLGWEAVKDCEESGLTRWYYLHVGGPAAG